MPKLKDEVRMEQIMSRQFRLWERSYDRGKISGEKRHVPCITISKEIGSQGVELGTRLSKRLDWELFDKNLVEYIADHAHVRKDMVELFDEKVQNEIHNWVFTLLDSYALGSDKYFKHLVTVIMSIGEHGRAIILGRGGNFILPPEKALRLKVVAPKEKRIETIAKDQKLNRKEAEKIVIKSDKERAAFVLRFFHRDIEEPQCYDMVINLGSLTLSAAEEIIMQALKAKFPYMAFDQITR